ncbi:MAG TPA: alcohol dehydrogenase catalytic domain-containing protein [Gaiellaceae bacterium]
MAVVDYGQPLVEIDVPEPRLRPGTAVIEVLTCGVCFSDVKTSRGQMPFSSTLKLPHIPGHEICGRVLETDPPGLFEPGQLVLAYHYWPCGRCRRCTAGDEVLCYDLQGWLGFTHPGGFQERLVVPVERLLRLPPGIDPVSAAPMTCALGTAYRATVTRGGVRAGTTVAVVGLGGVGIHALQVAAAAGAMSVGLDVTEASLELARGLGLDAVDARAFRRDESAFASIAEEGFDTVVVTAGSPAAYRQAGELVRRGGRIVAVGYALETAFELETPRLVLDEIQVLGSRFATRGELQQAIELVQAGLVKPVVGAVRQLEDVNEAFADLTDGRVAGRTVLRVAHDA